MAPLEDRPASEFEPSRDPRWLLEVPMIPLHGVTLVAGFRGATKTTFSCWLAAQVTAKGHTVFFCSQEDGVLTFLKPRVEAAGANLDLVRFPTTTSKHLRLPRDMKWLAKHIQRHNIRLVLIDPLGAVVPNLRSTTAVRDVIADLTKISEQTDCAMVLIHHFIKSGGKDVFQAIGGTGALTDAVRAVYVYGEEAEQISLQDVVQGLLEEAGVIEVDDEEPPVQRVLANAKISAAPKPPSLLFHLETKELPGLERPIPFVSLEGESGSTANMVLRAQREAEDKAIPTKPPSAKQVAIQWLLTYLLDHDKKVPVKQMEEDAKADGLSARTIERARAELRDHGQLRNFKPEFGGPSWIELIIPDTPPKD